MNIRDLDPKVLKKLAKDCEQRYTDWWTATQGKIFGSKEPIPPKKIFEFAFSKGVSAMLQRMDEVKER